MFEVDTRTIAVRNPRTGATDFTLTPASRAEIAEKAARLRRNQPAWAARSIADRIGVMRRWVSELVAHAGAIGAADGADTGGCHTSQFTAFIAVANINGWCEDAAGVLERAHVSGPSLTMPRSHLLQRQCAHWTQGRARLRPAPDPLLSGAGWRYGSVDEAVALANDTEFGLTASVIAGEEAEALPIAERINAGSVFVQDTFLTFAKLRKVGTNSFGVSGLGGSRTGPESIMRFLRRKAILLNHGAPADILDDRPADVAGSRGNGSAR